MRLHGRPLTERAMLYWALVFLVIAVVAGLLGFGGVASTAAGIAQVLFFIFLVVFVIALVMGLTPRRANISPSPARGRAGSAPPDGAHWESARNCGRVRGTCARAG